MLKYRDLDDIEDVVDLCQLKNACLCVCTVRTLFARVHASARLRS